MTQGAPRTFVLRAGPAARHWLQTRGLAPDDIRFFGAPAGGPKWLIQSRVDQALFGQWFAGRKNPLQAYGSSIGSYRLACAAQRDPERAFKAFESLYLQQYYPASDKAADISRKVAELIDEMVGASAHEVVHHPWLRLRLLTARCKGLTNSPSPLVQKTGFALAVAGHLLREDAMHRQLERCIFHTGLPAPNEVQQDAFTTHWAPLHAQNLRPVILASGAIPFVMQPVVAIPDGPAGQHLDGGLVDYHLDLPLHEPDGLYLIPHYEDRIVRRWFDKALKWRTTRHIDRMLVLSPSPWLKSQLVDSKIPSREDFKRYAGRDAERITAWQQSLQASQLMADELMHYLQANTLHQWVKPLEAHPN